MNKEQEQQIISDLRKMENSAQAVLDSGFGTHEGEHDMVYRKRRDLAKGAADLIESLQRERDNPQPLTYEQIVKRLHKPVFCAYKKRWGVVGIQFDKYTIGFGYGFEWLDDMLRGGEIYATEPYNQDHIADPNKKVGEKEE